MRKITDESPKGFDCQCCKKHHVYPLYVFAHWDEELTHTCDTCGAKHSIFRGVANLLELAQESNIC